MFFKGRKRQQFLFFCFQIKHRKDEQKRMKKKQTLWNGVSVLIVAVLAITAFIRGDAQFWLNVLAFGVWAIWATVKFLVPYIDQKLAEQEARDIREMCEEEERLMQDNSNPETTGIVLLRHVNHRISAYLKSAYVLRIPDDLLSGIELRYDFGYGKGQTHTYGTDLQNQ